MLWQKESRWLLKTKSYTLCSLTISLSYLSFAEVPQSIRSYGHSETVEGKAGVSSGLSLMAKLL